jgi:hypothetical protein
MYQKCLRLHKLNMPDKNLGSKSIKPEHMASFLWRNTEIEFTSEINHTA